MKKVISFLLHRFSERILDRREFSQFLRYKLYNAVQEYIDIGLNWNLCIPVLKYRVLRASLCPNDKTELLKVGYTFSGGE